MAIDFIRNPKPEHNPKPKIDFWKPNFETDEELYLKEKNKLEMERAVFEEEKRAVLASTAEPTNTEKPDSDTIKKKRGRPPLKANEPL